MQLILNKSKWIEGKGANEGKGSTVSKFLVSSTSLKSRYDHIELPNQMDILCTSLSHIEALWKMGKIKIDSTLHVTGTLHRKSTCDRYINKLVHWI